jgi:hypothetical protein
MGIEPRQKSVVRNDTNCRRNPLRAVSPSRTSRREPAPDPGLCFGLDADAPVDLSHPFIAFLKSSRATAVFGRNDRTAIRLLQLACCAGIDVPADLSKQMRASGI